MLEPISIRPHPAAPEFGKQAILDWTTDNKFRGGGFYQSGNSDDCEVALIVFGANLEDHFI